MAKIILGASLGNCIHVAGLLNFLKLAEDENCRTIFLGAAVAQEKIISAIKKYKPDLVALSYRLTPAVARKLFTQLKKELTKSNLKRTKFIFGGTPPVAGIAKESGIFEKVFTGNESIAEIKSYFRNTDKNIFSRCIDIRKSNLVGRVKQKYPYPLIRHHFGRPTLKETIEGVRKISEAGVLDVVSIGPDQNAQEHFFSPKNMDHSQDGAGGVPLRKPGDLSSIYKATLRGNYPLTRCYAGTRDLIKWAEMSVKNINIAWGAIPLCWYSVLDGRSERSLREAIEENQETIKWYARHKRPVEVNEAHQWSLRDAHDTLAVAMAFLAAYNAKKFGVRHFVAQYMFNTPPGTSPSMDLAKMLAKKELIGTLEDKSFTVFTQVRAGLSSFSPDPYIAKGQLASSALLSLALKPHILHVVGFSEGDHAITADELIESCKIIHGVLKNSLSNFPDITLDKRVQRRKKELLEEASILLKLIRTLAGNNKDPYINPEVLALAIEKGLLDAPHLKGNKYAKGEITTKIIDGKCCAVGSNGKEITETERIKRINISK